MRFLFVFPEWPKLPGQTPFNLPPLGVLQAAACLPEEIDVKVINENVEPIDFAADCDLVGISILLSCQAPRAYEIAQAFRERGKVVVLGGLHVTLCPEEATQHADAIVWGEGEGLIQQLVADFQVGRLKKSYRREGFPDLAKAPLPRRELHDKKRFYSYKGWELVDLVETSRGCRFNCYPCCTPFLGGRQHRLKPMDRVLADVQRCSDLLFIIDNSLEQNVDYERELFRSLAGCGKRWISHPITCEPDVLDLAQKAGCWYVYHVIFNISDKIKDRIQMYQDHGIAVEGTILLGLDWHTESFIRRLIDFLLTLDLDMAEFTVLTPFPHTEAHQQLERENRIVDRDWRHYNASTVVYQPRHMSPEKLQQLYDLAWKEFYRHESQTIKMAKLFLQVVRSLPSRGPAREGRAERRGP